MLEDVLVDAQGSDRDLGSLCSVLNQLSATCTALGDNRASLEYARLAVETAERLGNLATTLISYSNRGWSAYLFGDWVEAREDMEHAVAITEQVTFSWAAPYALLNLGVLCLAQGQPRSAWTHLERGRSLAEATKDLQLLRWLHQELAEVDLLDGQASAVRARLEPLLAGSGQESVEGEESIDILGLLPCFAWAYLELADEPRAKTIIEECRDRARASHLRPTQVAALRVGAMLDIRQGHWETATALLEQALELVRGMQSPYDELKLAYVYGALHAARDDRSAAREQYQQALALCDRLGEGGIIQRHRMTNRSGGVPVSCRKAACASELTLSDP
jgi:tetratricopeptide (TPR) repeat protein